MKIDEPHWNTYLREGHRARRRNRMKRLAALALLVSSLTVGSQEWQNRHASAPVPQQTRGVAPEFVAPSPQATSAPTPEPATPENSATVSVTYSMPGPPSPLDLTTYLKPQAAPSPVPSATPYLAGY